MSDIKYDDLTSEQQRLLLFLGLPALAEVALIESLEAEARIDHLFCATPGRAEPPSVEECNLSRTHTVLRGHRFALAVGGYLVHLGHLAHPHGPGCVHVKLTDWGRTFIAGSIDNIVRAR